MRFLEGLLAAQRCGWDHAQKVLTLLGIYRREDLLAALERAVRYGAFSAKSIETHPGGAGSPQDLLGPHGGRRTVSPGGTAVRRPYAAAIRDGISTPAL